MPDGIMHISDGRQAIHEGDDNVDINAETTDGKNTFHSMARVLFFKIKKLINKLR